MDVETIKNFMHYAPETGISTHRRLGREYTTPNTPDGYVRVVVRKKGYLLHRLIWLYMTGEFPGGCIDHINGNTMDNRWENLRDTDAAGNARNAKVRSDSSTGYRGVFSSGSKFRAKIRHEGVLRHLGVYDTLPEAKAAYRAAAILLHGEFACFER